MNKNREIIIIKGIPILIVVLLLRWTVESWWQLFDPIGFYKGVMDEPPLIFLLLKTILLTGIIAMSIAAFLGKRFAYHTIKWLLLIAAPISLYFLYYFVPSLWGYAKTGVNLTTWEAGEIPLTSEEKWINIYNPILISFGASIFIFIALWFWTREPIKSKFKNKSEV